jgi:hypothetical protein
MIPIQPGPALSRGIANSQPVIQAVGQTSCCLGRFACLRLASMVVLAAVTNRPTTVATEERMLNTTGGSIAVNAEDWHCAALDSILQTWIASRNA